MKNLISTDFLEKNIDNFRILDGSWHMPNLKRDSYQEFLKSHINNSIFFDLDKNSNKDSKLPHMLTSKNDWETIISKFGIKNSDHVIIYDNSDVISSCRIWYNFLYFGHNPNLVSILNGGFKKWISERRQTTKEIKYFTPSNYSAKENLNLVLKKSQIELNIKNKDIEIIDARSKERFNGLQPEPRKELRSGNIDGSKNIPFIEVINQKDNTFKDKEELLDVFKRLNLDRSKDIAFTCGSGVTACILGVANSIITGKNPIIYDGSWSEYGLKK